MTSKPMIAAAAVLATFIVGCGASPPPSTQLEATGGAIRAADEANAHREGRAAMHLQMARETLDTAKKYIAEEEMVAASVLLEEARADAELAFVFAQLDNVRREANQVSEHINALQQQIHAQ